MLDSVADAVSPALILAGALAALAITTRLASGLQVRLRQRGRLPLVVHPAEAVDGVVGDAVTASLRTFLAEDVQRNRALVPGGSGVVTPSIPAQAPTLDSSWTSIVLGFAFSDGPAYHVFTQPGRDIVGVPDRFEVQVVRSPGNKILNARSFAVSEDLIADIGSFCVQTIQLERSVLRQTPRWEHWAGRGGYRAFRSALFREQQGDLSEAVDFYGKAGALSIGNVTISLRKASILEQIGRHSEALREYALCHELWPESVETAYRYAAALSNSRDTAAKAAKVFSEIEDGLRITFIVRQYLNTWRRSRWNTGERAYWAGWLRSRPSSRSPTSARRSRRLDLRCAVVVARCVAILHHESAAGGLQGADASALNMLVSEVEKIRRRRKIGWLAHYNIACFYSTCLGVQPAISMEWDTAEFAKTAARELAIVIRDPVNEVHPAWMLVDPDLDELRRIDDYRHWFSYLGVRVA